MVKLLSEDPLNYADAPREGIRRIMESVTGATFPKECFSGTPSFSEENIKTLLNNPTIIPEHTDINKDLDIFSIDIDGIDYWVLEKINPKINPNIAFFIICGFLWVA